MGACSILTLCPAVPEINTIPWKRGRESRERLEAWYSSRLYNLAYTVSFHSWNFTLIQSTVAKLFTDEDSIIRRIRRKYHPNQLRRSININQTETLRQPYTDGLSRRDYFTDWTRADFYYATAINCFSHLKNSSRIKQQCVCVFNSLDSFMQPR